ncbi:lipopolysaccharide biosynthesis protein [Maribacter sp. 1_MG-2023]|uniref:lipopolysaccharide biosynthesis protein n=1 Tax=Maribacter sp. 1_MG-2023 TaxID=3062677 RepID=UPI0026E3D53C|nr:MATE family efflux transporter [Maribacter sp. 1_MG-2023]MDO6471530.1 MATE family efflux transporter [Maribacter sp. 1_MG-2023]
MSLRKRLLKNGIASVFQKGVRILDQLLLVPFFITSWGSAYYGEWLTLTIIPSVIAFSDLGFGTAAANSFVLSFAAGDKQKAADISKTGMYVITAMIIAAMVLSFVGILVLDHFQIFDKSLINSQDAKIAVSILIFVRLLNFYDQLIESYFRSAQKAALNINFLTIKSTLNLLAGLCVLLLGYGVVEFALSQLTVTILFNIFYWIKGRQILGLFKTFRGKKDKIILKSITRKGLGYLMSPVWQVVYFQGTTFVVRIVLGPEAVAAFNTVRTLSRSLNQLLFMVKTAVFPELQFEIGRGNWKTAQRVFRVSVTGILSLSIISFIFLAIFGLWFYNIWTQNELEIPKAMWYIFTAGMVFNALWWTAEMVFGVVNKPYKMALYGVIVAITSVLLSYFLSKQYGLVGAAIGSISLDFILVLLVIPYACRLMQMTVKDLFLKGMSELQELLSQLNYKFQEFKN